MLVYDPSHPEERRLHTLALKFTKPNQQLLQELKSVSQDAQAVIKSIGEQNFLPEDFPTATLVDICEALFDLPNGSAEGCRVPLEYARGRLPAIRRNHFAVETTDYMSSDYDADPKLLRGMSLDRNLSDLIASITTALDEYRYQASEQHDEPLDLLSESSIRGVPNVSQVVAGAEKVELSMRSKANELEEIAEPGSRDADNLSRALKDTEGLARVSKAELNFGSVVVRWYKNIAFAAKRMPKVILASAKAVKVGTDIAKSFSGRWMDMCENLIDFGLEEIDKWADTAIEVANKLQKRVDAGKETQGDGNEHAPAGEAQDFDPDKLYKSGYVSYIEKRGLYAFLVDAANNRYFLRLEQGHLRTGQLVEIGAIARFRYAENARGRTAIEVSFYNNAIFSTDLGVLDLDKAKLDFRSMMKNIAREVTKNNRVSLYSLGAHIESKFKSPRAFHEMLGYRSLSEYLQTVPDFLLSGEEPNMFVTVSEAESEPKKAELSVNSFKTWLEDLLRERRHENGILLSQLGIKARDHFDTSGRIPQKLGFNSYVQLLDNISSVRIDGESGGREYVVLESSLTKGRQREISKESSAKEREALNIVTFSSWLREILSSDEYRAGILLSELGSKARIHFDSAKRIPIELGFKTYVQIIQSLDWARFFRTSDGKEYVVLATSDQDDSENDLDVNRKGIGSAALSYGAFVEWLDNRLSLPENSDGILLSRLGLAARTHFEFEGKLPLSLGFSNYVSLIEDTGRFSITGKAPRQRVMASKT